MTETNDAMKHPVLNSKSEVFVDDSLERVDKRVFFLFTGKKDTDAGISI